MIYKNKAEAEQAANEFANQMLRDGHTVSRGDYDSRIDITYGCGFGPSSTFQEFKYHTLKKGDVCVVFGLDGDRDKTTKLFSGNYVDGHPTFFDWASSLEDGGSGQVRTRYEKTGYNILTGEHDEK